MLSVLLFSLFVLHAQEAYNCDGVHAKLENWEKRIAIISISDPDKIPLHYLFIRDISSELQQFYTQDLPQVVECKNINFNEVISRYDKLLLRSRFLLDTLEKQHKIVDDLFYQAALEEQYFNNKENCYYFVNRSLEYNPFNPNSLLLKLELLYQDSAYAECLSNLEVLYNKSQLNEEQEHRAMDFTAKFYDRLYTLGDSLVKADKSADALHIFQILEIFCLNMPSNYCNDDYYHGIIRSKTGVYESYLEIAKIARERKHYDIEARYVKYANDYANENHEILSQVVTMDTDAAAEIDLKPASALSVPDAPEIKLETATAPTETPRQELLASFTTETISPTPAEPIAEQQELPTAPASADVRPALESEPEPQVTTPPADAEPETSEETLPSETDTEPAKQETSEEIAKTEMPTETSVAEVPVETTSETENLEQLQEEYNRLVELGLEYCRNREYIKGLKTFQQAKAMEQESALEKDGRVKIMLNALDGIQ